MPATAACEWGATRRGAACAGTQGTSAAVMATALSAAVRRTRWRPSAGTLVELKRDHPPLGSERGTGLRKRRVASASMTVTQATHGGHRDRLWRLPTGADPMAP